MLKIGHSEIRTDQLSTLVSDRWLSHSVIQVVAEDINQGTAAGGLKSIVIFANDVCTSDTLVHKIKNTFGTTLGDVIFYLFVGNFETQVRKNPLAAGENYTRNHYSLVVYNIENDNVIYADTKGWQAPVEFFTLVQTLSEQPDRKSPNLTYCHDPGSHSCRENVCNDFL